MVKTNWATASMNHGEAEADGGVPRLAAKDEV